MSTALPPLRIAVVGGGFSGLAAAIRVGDLARAAGRPVQLQLREGAADVGGLVSTQKIGEYLVERGADSFITNKPGGVAICSRLGLESRLISTDPRFRQSFILHQGRPVATPAGFQLIAPTRIGAFLKSPLLGWRAKNRVLAEPGVPPRTAGGEESVASFVRRRFGDEAYERIVQPLVGGIYTGDLDRLSLQATFPRFAQMERQRGSVLKALRRQRTPDTSGARYGLFVSLPGGMSELLSAMSAEVSATQQVVLRSRVDEIKPTPGGRWEIRAGDKLEQFDAVILAVPAHQAAPLLSGHTPELAGELSGIEYSSSAIVVSGHRLEDVAHPLDGAGLVIPHVERRAILAVSFASRKFPGRAPVGRGILRTFLGGAMQSGRLADDDESLKRTVLQELESILGVRGVPDFCEIVRYPQGIPQFVIGHRDRVRKIETLVGQLPGLSLAGNAYHGVGIPDAVQSGFDAAEKVWADLAASPDSPNSNTPTIASASNRRDDLADAGHHLASGFVQ